MTTGQPFPRVPPYAWRWVQRSRPVIAEVSKRLTGSAQATGEFLDELRSSFEQDPFVRDVLVDVVAEVAFSGRIPKRRPPGASWDRGLTWWAAALAGTTLEEFDGRGELDQGAQRPLFDAGPGQPSSRAASPATVRRRPSAERLALARTLRGLLESSDGHQVPASAIRQLIADLEDEAPR